MNARADSPSANQSRKLWWDRLAELDRRWIYLCMALSVIFPLLVVSDIPIEITPESQKFYDAVAALPESSTVMLTFDYYASALPETEPASRAALHQLFRKNCKIVTVTTIPLGGPSTAERVTREVAAEFDKQYGTDYVNLGYKANYTAVLQGMGTAIETIYPSDNSGTPLAQLPLMASVRNYKNIDFIFIVADNNIVENWASLVNSQYGVPMGASVTAVMAPKFYPLVSSGQLIGMFGGMRGVAEYEKLIGRTDLATKGMGSQSYAHFVVIGLVVLGNVGYFLGKRKKGGAR